MTLLDKVSSILEPASEHDPLMLTQKHILLSRQNIRFHHARFHIGKAPRHPFESLASKQRHSLERR